MSTEYKAGERKTATMQALEGRVLLAVDFVTDINRMPLDPSVLPGSMVDLGGVLYYGGDDGTSGQELWRSDGTAGGTSMVRDIWPGASGSAITGLTVSNGALFFAANDATSGAEPWRSDGTAAGTYRLVDAYPGASSSPTGFTALGSATYFFAAGSSGTALWRTDGTAAGTTLVKVVSPAGPGGGAPGTPVVANGVMYFLGPSSSSTALWASDGTAAGTVQLQSSLYNPTQLTWLNGALYFTQYNVLYRSDGTTAAPVMIGAMGGQITELTAAGNRLYFATSTTAAGKELWSYDGSTAAMVKDIWPGQTGSGPMFLRAFNGRVLFSADDGVNGLELWISNGTAAGTTMIDLRPGSAQANPRTLTVVGGVAYCFTDATAGKDLWVTDGTTAGSRRLATFAAGGRDVPFHAAGSNVYFFASDAVTGAELWRTDGTAAGTALVRDVYPRTFGSKPDLIGTVGGRAYFFADDGVHGKELWSTDGTAAGTAMVLDAVPGSQDNFVKADGFATANYVYYYQRNTGSGGGYTVWRTDGTAAGTKPAFGTSSMYMSWAAVGERVFTVTDTGTMQVNEPGKSSVDFPNRFYGPMTATADGIVYLTGASAELWRSDGTTAGTYRVADLRPGGDDLVTGLTAVGNEVYFFAYDGTPGGNKLFKSDGTAAGTVLVKDVYTGGDDWVHDYYKGRWDGIAVAGGRLYFSGTTPSGGIGLWTSDGTAAGTRLAASPPVGADGGRPQYLVGLDDVVIYGAGYGSGSSTLMRSDGTPEGTYPLARLQFGTGTSGYWSTSVRVGNVLYLTLYGNGGNSVWRTDGTLAGTWMVTNANQSVLTGAASGGQIAAVSSGVVVTADDITHGVELYHVTPEPPLLVAGATFVPGVGAGTGLTLTFGRGLVAAPGAADLVVTNLTTGATVPAGNVRVALGGDGATVTVSFPGYPGGVLPDGNYRVTLAAGAVHDAAGNPLGRDFAFDFFVLAGDANRDRVVNFADLLTLAKNYNKTGVTWADGDFTGDGVVNFADLLVLAKAYNKVLAAPAPMPVEAVAPAMAAVTTNAVLADGDAKAKPVFSTTPVAKPAPKPVPVKAKAGARAKGR